MALDPEDIPRWQNRPILAADHADELEQEAALREFRDRKPRSEAEAGAHGDYVEKHHREAMAHHYRGMKAAQSLGQTKEGKKHAALYELHAKALGHDPYKELPPDVQKLVDDPEVKPMYRFKVHPADALLLQGRQTTERSEENPMADNKRDELVKKAEETWAAIRAKDQQAEALNTLYKAAKLALDIKKREESSTPGSHSESSSESPDEVHKADVPADPAEVAKAGIEGVSQPPATQNPAASVMKTDRQKKKEELEKKVRDQFNKDRPYDKPSFVKEDESREVSKGVADDSM